MLDPKLMDEPARLAALNRYEVLDTPREPSFDRITDLVRSILGVPISAVSLVDTDRQWFKSLAGLDATQTSRDVAFCAHTIRQRAPLIIADAQEDERFRDNPLVTGDPNIRSYAGIPLETPTAIISVRSARSTPCRGSSTRRRSPSSGISRRWWSNNSNCAASRSAII